MSRFPRDLDKLRAWERRSKGLQRGRGPRRRTRINPINRARRKKLRAEQFGTDGKREWILQQPCPATGARRVDPAHVLGTRATGHGPAGLCPLRRDVHRSFDGSITDERFELRWGISRDAIREHARKLEQEWQRLQTTDSDLTPIPDEPEQERTYTEDEVRTALDAVLEGRWQDRVLARLREQGGER